MIKKPLSNQVCRVKQRTYKYKSRKGFNGSKKKAVVNNGDVNTDDVNNVNNENLLNFLARATANKSMESPVNKTPTYFT